MQQSFQVWGSKRCSRHAYSFVQYRKSGRYTHRTDKRFHGQDIMFTTRTALATPCPEDRMSPGEKLPDLRATTNRCAVLLFQPRRENGRVFLVTGHFATV